MAWNDMLGFLLTSAMVVGCAGRTSDTDPDGMTTASDDEQDGDTEGEGDTEGDTEGDDATSADDGDSDDPTGDCEGECEAPSCDGAAPWCVPAQEAGETCVHGPDMEADCEYGEWACPEGFAFEEDVDCVPECEGAGCWIPCREGDTPPDECWDQGPGECADSTVPPNCIEGMWECPNGFDFGGYGEGCTFPGE